MVTPVNPKPYMGKEHALAKQKYKNCREKTHKRCA